MNLRPLLIAIGVGAVLAVLAAVAADGLLRSDSLPVRITVLLVIAIAPALIALAAAGNPATPAPTPAASRPNSPSSRARPDPDTRASQRPPDPAPNTVADGPRVSGNVKWFNRTKGFGFIVCDNGEEIFVHHRSIRGDARQSLRDGEPVNFVIVDHSKGQQAEDVVRVEP